MVEGDNNVVFPEISNSTQASIDFYTERFEAISDSAVSLFRINLVIVGLFLPLVSGLLDPSTMDFSPGDVFNNPYTQVGLFVWAISMIATLATQYFARRYSISQYAPIQEFLKDHDSREFQQDIADSIEYYGTRVGYASKALSGCFILSFLAVGLLAVGFIDPFVDFRPTSTLIIVAGLGLSSLAFGIAFIGILRVGISPQAFLAGLDLVVPASVTVGNRLFGISIYRTKWDELTQVRRSLLQAIGEEIGQKEFTRSDLEQAIQVASLTATVPTKTVSNFMLERLVEDNYLIKASSSNMVFIVDKRADEDDLQLAIPGTNKSYELVEQVVDRENLDISTSELEDMSVFDLLERINETIGEQVLAIRTEPEKYKLSDEALNILNSYFSISTGDAAEGQTDE